jgi:hypothetical protein
VKVSPLAVLVFVELNAAVTPEGAPDAVRATLLLNPFCPTTFTVVLAPEPPSKSVTVPAEVVSPNVGVGTVNCIVVIAETEPETPCTVRPYTPGIAEFDGVSVSALVLVVLTGLNDAVMPAGNPEMFNTTEPARFAGLTRPMVTVELAPPTASLTLLEEEERLKLGDNIVT